MKERPILFSAPMVRAIRAGTKTQTRRIVKLPKWADQSEQIEIDADGRPLCICQKTGCLAEIPCPYGEVGDRLWVREIWSLDHAAFYPNFPVVYRADMDGLQIENGKVFSPEQKAWYPFRWRPSIHMPRRFARTFLEIVSIRAERLQDISQEDAMAEGVHPGGFASRRAVPFFRNLWIDINGPESWELNPAVRVVEFRRITP